MHTRLIILFITILFAGSCSDPNRHQFKLDYESSAVLTVTCGNCYYYFGNYDEPDQNNVIEREIDQDAINLFSSIEFCGIGDTTPDGRIRIETDTGSVADIGVLFPNPEINPTLRIQSRETGLGEGCTPEDQAHFEEFFFKYANKPGL